VIRVLLTPVRAAAAALALAILALYSPGLWGPFVLDDHVNLAPIWAWLSGQRGLLAALQENQSGPAGRFLADLSFMVNAALGGQSTFGFKLANLLLHLGAGGLVYLLGRQVLAGGARVTAASLPALMIAACWLLHPMQVSSVLYVVQRMTLIGALAQLSAVLVYVEARQTQAQQPQRATLLLFAAFPALVLLGMLGKETAALAPLLCATLEITLFAQLPRPARAKQFFLLFLALPVSIGLASMLAFPERWFGAYAGREFTLAERLLTEPRVLLDYLQAWFWPSADHLGLYRDGYPVSHGMFEPLATAATIAFWIATAAAAWYVRRRNPLFSAGILWFLAAHTLESSVLPLEPYFEHRNYVASLGLLFAAAGLLRGSAANFAPAMRHVAWLLLPLLVLTGLRCHRWGDIDRLLASEGPPGAEISRRLQVDRAIRGFETGNAAASDTALEVLAAGSSGDRAAGALWQAILQCEREGRVAEDIRQRLYAASPSVLTHNHVSWLGLLADRAARSRCAGLTAQDVARLSSRWRHATVKPLTANNQARLEAIEQRLDAATKPTF
jgi:hypothetical protein